LFDLKFVLKDLARASSEGYGYDDVDAVRTKATKIISYFLFTVL